MAKQTLRQVDDDFLTQDEDVTPELAEVLANEEAEVVTSNVSGNVVEHHINENNVVRRTPEQATSDIYSLDYIPKEKR